MEEVLDPYIAERLVAGKQAELRAEAKRAALRAALARKSPMTEYHRSIGAIGVARRLLRRGATQVGAVSRTGGSPS